MQVIPRGPYATEEKAQTAHNDYDIENLLAKEEEEERIKQLIEERRSK